MLRSSRRNQQLLLACLAGLTLFLVFTRWNRSDSVVLVEESSERKEKEEDGVQMVCRLPKLEKDRPEVMKFYTDRKHSLNCASEKDWVFVDDEGRLQLTGEAIQAHGKDTPCSVSYILRVSDFDEKTEESPEKSMIGKKLVESDFFWANCKAASGKKWSGMLMTVVRNESRVEALKARQRPSWSDLNVYFFGLDSLSQMAYRRSLPKTVEFFEGKMGGVVLDGYNIVGDGTPQAFIPILTAKTELELPPTRKTHKSPTFVDVYPFIWNNFSDAGYVTVYGEDAAAMGIYSHRMKGFDKQPTDHYVRTFFQEAEKKASNLNCIGSNSMHNVWMKYGNEVIQRYKDIPRFELFHHGRLSHDDINLVSVMDDDFAANLEHLHSTGAFESTLVILMADHGHRFASLRNTHQGQLEERLPFFGLYLPERFRASGKGKKALRTSKPTPAASRRPSTSTRRSGTYFTGPRRLSWSRLNLSTAAPSPSSARSPPNARAPAPNRAPLVHLHGLGVGLRGQDPEGDLPPNRPGDCCRDEQPNRAGTQALRQARACPNSLTLNVSSLRSR
ncbi:hypothetical protein L596_027817 [Steinernema carpocapsae]|uniref:Uncharacterized protein n=1 Tax=Steinernema carpocapsae TaxID=34508 RepID=A0A4U5LWM6_STECR|nr:hypothetical protein L596_027817 [Steinernema carpocapsae]